jgi:hypothetical protein
LMSRAILILFTDIVWEISPGRQFFITAERVQRSSYFQARVRDE